MPQNVARFEVLLYASLILDAIAVAFADRTSIGSENDIAASMAFQGLWIVLQLSLVWMAVSHRQGWPRWILAANLLLAGLSLPMVIVKDGVTFELAIEMVSCALTIAGLYLSFTKEAQGWFSD